MLTNTKTRSAQISQGPRAAGTPIQEMPLRLVANEQLDTVEAGSRSRWIPFASVCNECGNAYTRLVGLNRPKDFCEQLAERLRGRSHPVRRPRPTTEPLS